MTTAITARTIPSRGDGSMEMYRWTITTANFDGAPVSQPEWADRTWQANGTWGGATLIFQGSNDNVNWFTLTNAAGGLATSLTANGGMSTIELPLFVRPFLSVVGAGATVTVTLLMRRATPMRT